MYYLVSRQLFLYIYIFVFFSFVYQKVTKGAIFIENVKNICMFIYKLIAKNNQPSSIQSWKPIRCNDLSIAFWPRSTFYSNLIKCWTDEDYIFLLIFYFKFVCLAVSFWKQFEVRFCKYWNVEIFIFQRLQLIGEVIN